jgi:uncharacterized 2Fe-2S/4Fe-4S cluster protein (DUF4445 family)
LNDFVKIELVPSNKALRVPRGTPLQDLLFVHGVEFPCGGRGKCNGCRIKVISGALPVSSEDSQRLKPEEIAQGWRLACRAAPEGDLTIELAQWEAAILSDESAFAFTPQKGWGIAVDLGTTTIVAQLLELQTGQVLGVRTALNLQAKHGADVMSRVEFAVAAKGADKLKDVVREQIGELVGGLCNETKSEFEKARREFPASLQSVVIVGNSVMHHLFCGIDLEPMSHVPFEPQHPGLQTFSASELGWKWAGGATVHFLPCLGGFVGSDVLAGILATNLHRQASFSALMDLGTNGEIVVGNRDRLLCASTAAGPAFEGARISMGMRAATGAISEVHLEAGQVRCHVLGNAAPRGICGSGLVDAVAVGLDLGRIQSGGRLVEGSSLALTGPISLSQGDIRELQLAKGAIAAGLRILLQRWGAAGEALSRIYLAGAFGNYINYASAKRIGLLNIPMEKVVAAGNTALLGAKMALFNLSVERGGYSEILNKMTHVSLNEDPRFQEVFVEEMGFPSLPLMG